MKITEYCIITSFELKTLEKSVNDKLKQGWTPKGGISKAAEVIGMSGYRTQICQVMVKYE